MPVSDYADTNATATRLVYTTGDPPTYEPPADAAAIPVAALPSSGSEKVSIGKEISQTVYKVFCDLGADGSVPFTTDDRVRLSGIPDGGDFDILSIQPYTFGEDIALIMAERYA